MPERSRRPDLDERFSLDADPERVLERILAGEGSEASDHEEPEDTEEPDS